MGILLHSCVEVRVAIELLLGEVIGVIGGMGVVDGVHPAGLALLSLPAP